MKRKVTPPRLFVAATLLLLAAPASMTVGQAPAGFNYQAVLRDAVGNLQTNESVAITLVLHQGTSTGTSVYEETHNTATNELGQVNLEVGSVDPAGFSGIDWATGPYFLEVLVNGTSMGTSQLLSVPYALYAASAPSSELGENSVNSSHVTDNSLGVIDLAADEFSGWDQDESDDFSGDYDDLSNKPASFDDADADPANELQSLELTGDTLSLTPDGGSVILPSPVIPDFTGVEFTTGTIQTWPAGTFETKTLATLEMSIPSSGFVLLIHSGLATFFGQNRRMYAGVGASTDNTTFDVFLGYLDGDDNERYNIPYTATAVIPVTEGTNTFFATGHGDDTFDGAIVNMRASSFAGIFIPLQY